MAANVERWRGLTAPTAFLRGAPNMARLSLPPKPFKSAGYKSGN